MKRFEDANDPLNGEEHHTGKPCINPGCERPAGTHWSRLWCQPCNAARMLEIGTFLEDEVARLKTANNQMKPNA